MDTNKQLFMILVSMKVVNGEYDTCQSNEITIFFIEKGTSLGKSSTDFSKVLKTKHIYV